jgi:hypothetical protein
MLSELYKIANKVFGHYLIDVGMSINTSESSTDIDTVVVVSKLDIPKVNEFKKEASKYFKKDVSCVVMTELMLRDKRLWSDKFVTMVFKGIEFINSDIRINLDLAKELAHKNTTEAMYRWLKDYSSGKITADRLIDLLVQQICLLV